MTDEPRPAHGPETPQPSRTPPAGSVFDALSRALPGVALEAYQGARDVVVEVDRDDLPAVLRAAKDDPSLRFDFLRCLSGVDYQAEGLEAVYNLHSYTLNHDVTIKVRVPQDDPRVPSATAVWRGADWYEREAAEMFGIVFTGHPNLVPILLPDDMIDYHPLLKSEPLAPVEVSQSARLAPSSDGEAPA